VRSIPLGATDVPPIDNSHQFVTAAQQRSALAYEWADAALRVLAAAGQPISFPAVADVAGVSKAYLYAQHENKTLRDQRQLLNSQLAAAHGALREARVAGGR
jgi:hypothetical protein